VAALPLPLKDFHLLASASFAGRTHQYHRLNVPCEGKNLRRFKWFKGHGLYYTYTIHITTSY